MSDALTRNLLILDRLSDVRKSKHYSDKQKAEMMREVDDELEIFGMPDEDSLDYRGD